MRALVSETFSLPRRPPLSQVMKSIVQPTSGIMDDLTTGAIFRIKNICFRHVVDTRYENETPCIKGCYEDCNKISFETKDVTLNPMEIGDDSKPKDGVEYEDNFFSSCEHQTAANATTMYCKHATAKYAAAWNMSQSLNIDPRIL